MFVSNGGITKTRRREKTMKMLITFNPCDTMWTPEHRKEYLMEEAANACFYMTLCKKAYGLEEEEEKKCMDNIRELVKLAGGGMDEVYEDVNLNMDYIQKDLLKRMNRAGSLVEDETMENA